MKSISITETHCYNCLQTSKEMMLVDTNYSTNSPICPCCFEMISIQKRLALEPETISDLN